MTTPPAPFVTVAVCTRDRPAQLGVFLRSAYALDVPPGLDWELLVVDNGSAGSLASLMEEFDSALPLRCVKEPAAGISNARNRVVREARGEYICWADDDTILDRDWLTAYLAAFQRHPEAAIFGGRILARLEEPTPRWLRRSLGCWQLQCVFAHRDFDDAGPISADRGRAPWGANFAVRAVEQRQFEYDPTLGYSPEHNRAGEESDVGYRILAAGITGWWVPQSVVHHVIPGRRQTRSHVHSYFIRAGETAAYVHANFGRSSEACQSDLQPAMRMSRGRLWLYVACHWTLFIAASAARLSPLTVRFLAAAGFYRGVLNHRAQCAGSVRPIGGIGVLHGPVVR